MASQILSIPYADAKLLWEDQREEVDNARQSGKIANFGFPGGLGAARLCEQAWQLYRVKMQEDQARQLKAIWLGAFPEFRQYFTWIDSHMGQDGYGAFKHLFSDRVRGEITFTQCCNTTFQGLGSDATGRAGWLVSHACYIDRGSALYGSRIVNYIHDQFILETPDTPAAHDAAQELKRLMIQGANEFLPDVPATCEPLLCRQWSKKAKAVHDNNGRLIPWEYDNG